MSEYPDHSPYGGQDEFDQQDDGHLAVPNSRDPNSVYSRHRDVTWITTSQVPSVVPRPPSRPLPTPVIRVPSVVVRAPSEELDAEYMTVDPDEDFEVGPEPGGSELQTSSLRRRGATRNFVGGFVSGLRKLPRAVLRTRANERKPVQRGPVGIDDIGETDHYESPSVMGPRPPVADVLYVETAEMPGEYPDPSDAHSVLTNGHPDGRTAPSTHSHFTTAPVAQSDQSHFTDAPAAQSSHDHYTDALGAQSPRSHITNDPRTQSRAHSPHSAAPDSSYNPHTARSATHEVTPYDPRDPRGPHDLETGETTMVHDAASPPDAADSPVYVEPRPASDYDKMPSPIRSPSVTSLNSRFVRVGKFFQDLYDLPWVAARITADYVPSDQSRARYRQTRNPWYTSGFHSRIDLLAGGQYTPPHRVRSPGNPMPDSSATLAYYSRPDLRSQSPPFERTRSPLYAAHQNRSRPFSPHEDHYPTYPHGYAPGYGQPLYVPAPSSSPPQMRPGFHSNSVSVAGQGYLPERQYRVTPSSPRPFVPPSEHMPAPPGNYYPHPMSRAPTIRPT